MRLLFAGTPAFSVQALDALHAAGHHIVGVYTQPDRPAGRGLKLSPSPVALRAAALDLPLFKPARLRGDAQAIAQMAALEPELMVVVAYGLILPQAVLDIPRHGCFNIHASLLPRWRGAAPIQRAILAGDTETGITIMQMDAGLDTGPMLLREAVPIEADCSAARLHDRLAALGASLIVDAVAKLQTGELQPVAQPEQGACYAHKIDKDEARLDWTQSAVELDRRVRGFNPMPMAWTTIGGERLRVLAAQPLAQSAAAAPGTVVAGDASGIDVATADGLLRLLQLQFAGGKPIRAAEALRGRIAKGQCLE